MPDPTHPSLPESDPAPPVPESVRPDTPDEEIDLSHLPPEHRSTVRRLQAQVDRATTVLERLQAENERLRRRIKTLEKRPAIDPNTTTFILDDDPETMRDRIGDFIDTIDTFLDDGAPEPTDAAPADAAS